MVPDTARHGILEAMTRSAAGDSGTGTDGGRAAAAPRATRSARTHLIGLAIALVLPMLALSGFAMLRFSNEERAASLALLLLAAGAATLISRSVARSMQALSATRLADQSRERDAAEAALRRSEQRFRDIAEVSGDWIWETDREHRFIYFSKTREQTIGRDPLKMLGQTRWEATGVDPDVEPFVQHRADLKARRPICNLRYSAIGSDGQDIHYCVDGKPVFDEAGEFLGYRGTTTNETAIVEARARAERAEALLQDALDSISAGILIYDQDDRLVMANESWRQVYRDLLGLPSIGKTFEQVLRDGLAVGHYKDAIGREEVWLAERIRHHRSGTGSLEMQVGGDRWFLVTDRRMRNGGIAGLRVEITELKTAQAALQASEERLDRAQQVAGIGSWELDVATGQYLWSKEMFRIRGFAPDAAQPTMTSLVRTIHEADFPKVHAWLKQLRAGGEPSAVEFRIRRPDGEERVIASEGRASRDASGTVARVTGTARDVTELRRADAQRQELEHQLRHSQKLEALGTLAGGIAHDLNNTLVPVVAMASLGLKRAGDDPKMRQYLELIKDAGNRARDLVKRVLAFSRKDRAERQEFSMAGVVREALAMLRATTPSTISLASDIRPVPGFVGDPTQIHQIVVNLVTNAVQAIGNAAGTVSVTLSAVVEGPGRKPTSIRLVVSDTGCGMDDATAQRIFEPFFTTKGVGEGTGLGLSVVHGIVTAQGGTIKIESRPGQGSRFVVELPMASEIEVPFAEKIPA